jgi:excisionase family DNA binding protein
MGRYYFTTNDIAKMCNVTRQTVINWIKNGKLRANLTPGGHRRVLREDLVPFFESNQLDPCVIEEYEQENRKRAPYCWEYFAVGFPGRNSRHECDRCLIKEARAKRCFVLSHRFRKDGDACQTGCERCGYFKRFGSILQEETH